MNATVPVLFSAVAIFCSGVAIAAAAQCAFLYRNMKKSDNGDNSRNHSGDSGNSGNG